MNRVVNYIMDVLVAKDWQRLPKQLSQWNSAQLIVQIKHIMCGNSHNVFPAYQTTRQIVADNTLRHTFEEIPD